MSAGVTRADEMAAGAPAAGDRGDGRSSSHLRLCHCIRGLLERAHGSARWSQGETTVLAAVYGPKSVLGKKENPERATLEILWKCNSGLASCVLTLFDHRSTETEAQFVIRRTLEHIVLASLHPNTGISIILQVVNDDGSQCLYQFAAAVSCAVVADEIILNPTKGEEKKFADVCLVFLSRPKSVIAGLPVAIDGEPAEHAILTCLTRGAMSVKEYLNCLEKGRAAIRNISEFSRWSLDYGQGPGNGKSFIGDVMPEPRIDLIQRDTENICHCFYFRVFPIGEVNAGAEVSLPWGLPRGFAVTKLAACVVRAAAPFPSCSILSVDVSFGSPSFDLRSSESRWLES